MDKHATVYAIDPNLSSDHKEAASTFVSNELANRMLWGRVSDVAGVVVGSERVVSIEFPRIATVQLAREAIKLVESAATVEQLMEGALEMIAAHCKKLKYVRRVIIILSHLSKTEHSTLLSMASDESVTPTFMVLEGAVDLQHCLRLPTDMSYTHRPKRVKPISVYRGFLTLGWFGGETNHGFNSLAIEVVAYPILRKASALTASHFDSNFKPLKVASEKVVDGFARETVEKGYRYGFSGEIVPIPDDIEEIARRGPAKTDSLEIIGFMAPIPEYCTLSTTNVVVPASSQDASSLAILVKALYTCESVAVARLGSSKKGEVSITMLEPYIDSEGLWLVMKNLPFKQDYRCLQFPPLEAKVGPELQNAMDDLVSEMSVPNADAEAILNSSETYNPYIVRVESYIKHKALNQDETIPEFTAPFACGKPSTRKELISQVLRLNPIVDMTEKRKIDNQNRQQILLSTKSSSEFKDWLKNEL